MTTRTEKLDFIKEHLRRRHVGWRNAISAKSLAAAAGLKPNELRADRHSDKRGYIPELRKKGFEVLSCVKGYYVPRRNGPGRDEDYEKHRRWTRSHGIAEITAHREAERAPRYAGEMELDFS